MLTHGSSCQRASQPVIALVAVSVDEGRNGLGTSPKPIRGWYAADGRVSSSKGLRSIGHRGACTATGPPNRLQPDLNGSFPLACTAVY